VEAVEKKIRGKIRQIAADEANFFQDCCTTTCSTLIEQGRISCEESAYCDFVEENYFLSLVSELLLEEVILTYMLQTVCT